MQNYEDRSYGLGRSFLSLGFAVALGFPTAHAGEPVPDLEATAPTKLHMVVPFLLSEPYKDRRNEGLAPVSNGVFAVVESSDVQERGVETLSRLLLCNGVLAEPLNPGDGSGVIVAILPGAAYEEDGIESALIWFGSRMLPERVSRDATIGDFDRARGILGVSARVDSLLKRSSGLIDREPVRFANKRELLRYAAMLIRAFAPDDEGAAASYSVPESQTYAAP